MIFCQVTNPHKMTTSNDGKSIELSLANLAITDPSQAPPDRLISLVNSVAQSAVERSEARYFKNATAPRDSACKSVLEKLNSVLGLLKQSQANSNQGPSATQATQSWHAPCIFNGSGSGKTFFNHFLHEHVLGYATKNTTVAPAVSTFLQSHQVLRVWISQFNGQQVPQNETDLKLYVAAVIASQLLLEKQQAGVLRGASVITLLNKIHEAKAEALFTDFSTLITAIRIVQSIPDNEPFLILFGHDEMQMLTDAKELMGLDDGNRKQNKIYKYVISAMDFAIAAAGHNVAVFNLFTGTFPLDSTSLLAPTIYQWSPVTFDPLTPADGITLLKSQHPSLKEILEADNITTLLEMFGNVPRVWELFSKELEKNTTAFSSSKSVVKMCDAFAEHVQRWSIPIEQLHVALLVMVQRWTLEDVKSLQRPEIELAVKNLIYDGRLFTREGGKFFIPIIFLRNSVRKLDNEDPCHEIFIQYANDCLQGKFDDRVFEKFCLAFLVMKFNLFIKTKFDRMSLQQFFRGSWMKENIKGQIRIGDKPIRETYETARNMTSFNDVQVDDGVVKRTLKDVRAEIPIALWIGKTDPHQDALLLLPDDVSIHLEMKFSRVDAQGTLSGKSKASFTHEQEMAEKSPVKQENSYFIYITNQFLTDKPKKKEKIHQRSFIVCANNFSEFFSGIFSFLTKMYQKNSNDSKG